MDPAILIAAILGAGGIGGAAAWRKAGEEADSIAATTLIAVNKELRTEIARLRSDLDQERRDSRELRGRVAELERRLDAA